MASHQPYFLCLFLLLLVVLPCSNGTRLCGMVTVDHDRVTMKLDDLVILRERREVDTRSGRLVFNFFPKGTRIPPSGPSKRHNAVEDAIRN
ncbi:hypothetical protein GIB67_038491 [Kingdonia uniflora]|uniref:Uncharacterized protein n=1 Tax=Kingdonia uniflora TaxID=39325 RepID=A0A7J7NPT8_9MAGN|nr:hypothetical protein GIB67_038491 [Kingdonia uniflora]